LLNYGKILAYILELFHIESNFDGFKNGTCRILKQTDRRREKKTSAAEIGRSHVDDGRAGWLEPGGAQGMNKDEEM
jgi:hypothetical protein